eukprot:CFRG5235T1
MPIVTVLRTVWRVGSATCLIMASLAVLIASRSFLSTGVPIYQQARLENVEREEKVRARMLRKGSLCDSTRREKHSETDTVISQREEEARFVECATALVHVLPLATSSAQVIFLNELISFAATATTSPMQHLAAPPPLSTHTRPQLNYMESVCRVGNVRDSSSWEEEERHASLSRIGNKTQTNTANAENSIDSASRTTILATKERALVSGKLIDTDDVQTSASTPSKTTNLKPTKDQLRIEQDRTEMLDRICRTRKEILVAMGTVQVVVDLLRSSVSADVRSSAIALLSQLMVVDGVAGQVKMASDICILTGLALISSVAMDCFDLPITSTLGHNYDTSSNASSTSSSVGKNKLLYDLRKLLVSLTPGDPCMKHVVKQAKIKVDTSEQVKRKESDARFITSTTDDFLGLVSSAGKNKPEPLLQGKCIQALAHLSTVPTNRYAIVAEGGLSVLMDTLRLSRDNATHKDRLAVARIIANVCQEESLVGSVIEQGWLLYMVKWSRCGKLDLEGEAYRALSNMNSGAERMFLKSRTKSGSHPRLGSYSGFGSQSLSQAKDIFIQRATETAQHAQERFPMLGVAYEMLQSSDGYGLITKITQSNYNTAEQHYSRSDWTYDDGVYVMHPFDHNPRHKTHTKITAPLATNDPLVGINSLQDAQSLSDTEVNSTIVQDPSGEFDIVFVHGLLGGAFFTWRQEPSSMFHRDTDIAAGETLSWPRDWLPDAFPTSRVISVEYDTQLTDWEAICPTLPATQRARRLKKRAKVLLKKLRKAGIGDRPVVWVTHSMGGLLAKSVLVESSGHNNILSDVANNTIGIVFLATPHRGSQLADLFLNEIRHVVLPSVEVNELKRDSPLLYRLNENFSRLKHISCLSIGETKSTWVSWVWSTMVVPKESSNPGYGQFEEIDSDHFSICKPKSRDDPRYTNVVDFIRTVMGEHEKKVHANTQPKQRQSEVERHQCVAERGDIDGHVVLGANATIDIQEKGKGSQLPEYFDHGSYKP